MAKKTELFDENDNDSPDNLSIRIDQIFDICDYTIRRCWDELLKDTKSEISLDKLEKIIGMTKTSWDLLFDVMSSTSGTFEEEEIQNTEDEDSDLEDDEDSDDNSDDKIP